MNGSGSSSSTCSTPASGSARKAVRIGDAVDVERQPAPCRRLEGHRVTVQGTIAQSPAAGRSTRHGAATHDRTCYGSAATRGSRSVISGKPATGCS